MCALAPFTIWKGCLNHAKFSQGDKTNSGFVSTNKQMWKNGNFCVLYFRLQFINKKNFPTEDVDKNDHMVQLGLFYYYYH